MLTHHTYFDGNVQSLGFERNGRRQTTGVILTGEYHFGTAGAERMTIVSGEATVRLAQGAGWTVYPAGTSFEVAASSGFDIRVTAPTAYLCEFI
jgi:uncharacterized protein YaiE (UPF0345 family)